MEITAKHRNQFTKEGYVIVRKAFDGNIVSNIRHKAENLFKSLLYNKDDMSWVRTQPDFLVKLYEVNKEAFINCCKQMQQLIELNSLATSDYITKYLDTVCNIEQPILATRPVLMVNNLKLGDGYHTIPLHRDSDSVQGSSNAAVIWVPLVSTYGAYGPLMIIPGSHRWDLPSTKLDSFGFGVHDDLYSASEYEPVAISPGDLLLFDAKLLHKSGVLGENATRWSCHFRYNDLADETFIGRKYPYPYIYKPVKLKR